MPPSDDEPFRTPLIEGMSGMHEMFVALVESGFTELQAIQYLAYLTFLQSGGGNDPAA